MNIVLDTNVLLVSLPSHSIYHPSIRHFKARHTNGLSLTKFSLNIEEQIGMRLGISRTDIEFPEVKVLKANEFLEIIKNL